jgi:transposase
MGLFAGIDVAKDTLAVAVSSGQEWSCANDPRGITLLVERLEAANPALVVLEATGGYEEELLAVLIAAGIETRRVNPREVHHLPARQDNWPRLTESMLACWPTSPSVYACQRVRCPTPSASNSRRWSAAAASCCR